LATVTVPLADDHAAATINRLIDALEDHDDVKDVYSNAQFPEDAAKG
jgi:transcriptional/translational regulatory protein YebC/TACO1